MAGAASTAPAMGVHAYGTRRIQGATYSTQVAKYGAAE
jgi:hypothetical protein